MTVNSTTNRIDYDSGSTSFSFPYKVLAQEDLVVTQTDEDGVESTLVLDTDYTVTMLGVGATVTLDTALPVTDTLSIERIVDLTQDVSLPNQGAFFPATIEAAFDKLTMIAQQQQDALDIAGNALRFDPDVVADPDFVLPDPEYGMVLGWNATEDGLINVENYSNITDAGMTQLLDADYGDALVAVKYPFTGATARTQHEHNADTISVKDFGAVGDGVADDTTAFEDAIAACEDGTIANFTLRIPAGVYKITSGLSALSTNFLGDGSTQSSILWAPTANGTCLTIGDGVTGVAGGYLRGLHIYTEDTTYTKTALKLDGLTSFIVDDLYISGTATGTPTANYWGDGTYVSVGIDVDDCTSCTLGHLNVNADAPVTLTGVNTSTHFHDCKFVARDNYSVVASRVYGLVFDGAQLWEGGVGGFHLDDAVVGGGSTNVVLKNVRFNDQNLGHGSAYAGPSTEWCIKLLPTEAVSGVLVENCYFSADSKGLKAQDVNDLKLANVVAVTNGVALQVVGDFYSTLTLDACTWGASCTFDLTYLVPANIGAYSTTDASRFPSSATFRYSIGDNPYSTWTIIGRSVATSSVPADTSEDTLATIPLKAEFMGSYGCLKITTFWSTTNNANAKTARVRLGGGAGTDFLAKDLASNALHKYETLIFNTDYNVQVGSSAQDGSATGSTTAGAIDTSAATTIVITGQKASAGDTMTLVAYIVELAGG